MVGVVLVIAIISVFLFLGLFVLYINIPRPCVQQTLFSFVYSVIIKKIKTDFFNKHVLICILYIHKYNHSYKFIYN